MLACPVVTRANTTYTWDGSATVSRTGYFDNTGNWVAGNTPPAPPTSGPSDLIFGSVNTQGYEPYTEFNYNLSSITFNSSAVAYAIGTSSNNTIAVGAGGITDSAANAESFNLGLILSTSQTWTVGNAAGSLTLSGSLTNSSSSTLTRTGSGTLNLALSGTSGISALALQGGTTQISSGTLALNQTVNGTLDVLSSTLNLSGGAVVNSTANGLVSVIIDSASTVNVNGAQLNALGGSAEIDAGRNGNGVLNVSNSGSISTSNYLTVGLFSGGNGTLSMSSSATASAPYAIIGGSSGATGTVKVSASTLNVTTNLEMGGNTISGNYGGTSTLTITNSGTVNAAVTTFYSNNSLINISGGTLNTAGLNSNASGNGAIMLADPGGKYALNLNASSGTYIYSGAVSGSGTINKSGGSAQTFAGSFSCGNVLVNGGTLSLAITNSSTNVINSLSVNSGLAQLTSGYLSVGSGNENGTFGFNGTTIYVSSGATLNINGNAFLPTVDNGTLTITGSGATLQVLAVGGLSIGTGSTGTVNVTQGGKIDASTDALLIGGSANGTLSVQGGTVTASMVNLAGFSGSSGNVSIGASSTFTTASLDLGGFSGSAGQVGGTGTITLTNGGILTTTGVTSFDSSTSSINVSGGVMSTGALSSYQAGFGSIALQNPDAAHVLTINGTTGTNTYSGSITGIGGLNKSGGSTQIFTGTDSFTGPVQVSGGELDFNQSNHFTLLNISNGSAVRFNPGATVLSGTSINLDNGTFIYGGSTNSLQDNFTVSANGAPSR